MPAFRVTGGFGFVAAVALASALAAHGGLRWPVVCGIAAAGALTFLALAMAAKVVTGRETLVYHHHEIAVMAVAAAFLRLSGAPLLPYLDLTALGIGLMLGFGRIGCLLVGCCHGAPCGWGIRYHERHAEAGFCRYYVGVRLFPVQALESLWVFAIVAAGAAEVWRGAPAGTALAWYAVAYNLGRFGFEFLRGDAPRPYFRSFSEAQWTALAATCVVAWAEWRGLLPFHGWHVAAAAGLAVGMAALGPLLQRNARHRFLRADHIREIFHAVDAAPDPVHRVRPHLTSLGVQISQGRIAKDGRMIRHYALSLNRERMSEPVARILAEAIARLHQTAAKAELRPGNNGVYHVLFPAGEDQ